MICGLCGLADADTTVACSSFSYSMDLDKILADWITFVGLWPPSATTGSWWKVELEGCYFNALSCLSAFLAKAGISVNVEYTRDA